MPNIYADTALGGSSKILDFVKNFGPDRIIFGSDYPFGSPTTEKQKIVKLCLEGKITKEQADKILVGNISKLMKHNM